eukprot:1952879-Amphidinium_carterae.1
MASAVGVAPSIHCAARLFRFGDVLIVLSRDDAGIFDLIRISPRIDITSLVRYPSLHTQST